MNDQRSNQMIDKDELTESAVLLDSVMYLMQELTENYFTKLNPNKSKDAFGIAWEFERYRAVTQAIYELIFRIQKDFEKNNITPYN